MNKELVIEVDINDKKIGLRPREDFHEYNIFHRSSVLLLFNDKDEVLLQKRSENKKWFPGMYDFSVAGTVNDETYENCMRREIKEEIGINLNFNFLFKMSPNEKNDKAYHSVFIGKTSEELILDKEEVESVEWISVDKLKTRISSEPNNFTPQLLVGLKKYFNHLNSDKK